MDHARFGAIVVRLFQPAIDDNARHGGDIDNRAAARLRHQFRLRFTGVPDAGQVNIDHLLPLFAFHFQRWIGVSDAGSIDRHVETSIAFFYRGDGVTQVGQLAYIAGKGAGVALYLFNTLHGFSQPAILT